mgnify:CR=1 FL=1
MSTNVIDLGQEDEGFRDFKLGETTVSLDIFKVFNDLSDITKKRSMFPDMEGHLVEDIAELLKSYGFSKISHAAALKFVKHIKSIAADLKKNIDMKPTSPRSTD